MHENLCRDNGRRYFAVDFDGSCHNYRVSIIKNIPSVKIRRDKYYNNMQMMIGVSEPYVEILLFELRLAKRRDNFCRCYELGYNIPRDVLKGVDRDDE